MYDGYSNLNTLWLGPAFESRTVDHEGGAFLGLSDQTRGLFQILVPKSSGLETRANIDITTIVDNNTRPVNPVLDDAILYLIVLNIFVS